ncbi:MAG: alpha/beta fold hydrolase, partial [Acidimicrobiia bacterium]
MSREPILNEQGTARTQALAARRRLLDGPSVTERVVEVAGIETSLLEGGEGRPLVLLHGQGASAVAWAPIIPALRANHRVVVPDLPGLGESQVHHGELDATRVTEWLNGLVAETCDEPPTIVGLSLGGTIAIHFAVDHGDKCRSLVLVDSSSLGPFRPSLGGLT